VLVLVVVDHFAAVVDHQLERLHDVHEHRLAALDLGGEALDGLQAAGVAAGAFRAGGRVLDRGQLSGHRVRKVLIDVLVGPELERLVDVLHLAVGGEDDDFGDRILLPRGVHDGEALGAFGHAHVSDDDVIGRVALDLHDALGGVRCQVDFGIGERRERQAVEARPRRVVVIHQQQAVGHRTFLSGAGSRSARPGRGRPPRRWYLHVFPRFRAQ
jgi:hypothetical protein